jgi:hypothetical protein
MDEIFVFGSNEAGRHGAGAARYAALNHGAQYGVGFGPTGRSFAIPTKDFAINTLSLESVKFYVDIFLLYAKENPHLTFRLTPIGCGLAGFEVDEIVPLFDEAPNNVLPPDPSFDKISKEFYEAMMTRKNYFSSCSLQQKDTVDCPPHGGRTQPYPVAE